MPGWIAHLLHRCDAPVVYDPATLITLGLTAAGTAVSAVGQIQAGKDARAAAEAQAAAERRKADEVTAASQRDAVRKADEAKRLLSRSQALAAASGGGATDPTVLKLQGDIAEGGEYNVLSALYNGQAQAAGLQDQADIDEMKGQSAQRASYINATSTLLTGASGFADKYSKFRYGGAA